MSSPSTDASSRPPDLVIRVALLQRDGEASRPDVVRRGHDMGKDYMPDCDWKELNPTIWRTFRCSSAINLDVFQDKVLQPVMGWTRNYHSYWFEPVSSAGGKKTYYQCPPARDMAEYPDSMSFRDRTENGTRLNSQQYTIGDILKDTSSKCRYVYDFGDLWVHDLHCEQVIPFGSEEASTSFGNVQVLNGAMRCPDEDGGGGNDYQEEILDLLLQVKKDKSNKKTLAKYAEACFKRVDAINVRGIFDAEEFDLGERQQAVSDALHTTFSCRDGPKMPGGGGSGGGGGMMGMMKCIVEAVPLGPGQRLSKTPMQDSRFGQGPGMVGTVIINEIINCKPDEEKLRLCYYCGNPWQVKTCSRCKIACYCSSECQVEDWKSHHKKCCKNRMAKEFAAYQAEKARTKPVPDEPIYYPTVYLKFFDPQKMRFKIGDQVECSMAENTYIKATVIQVMPRGDSGNIVAYQCEMNYPDCKKVGAKRGQCIWAIWDHDHIIRAA